MFREIRRKDRLISQEAGLELLKTCSFGVLSVSGDDGYPYGVPVNYAYKDNCIYIHCFLDGHKIDAIKKSPKVCFTVVDNVEIIKEQISTNYISVVVFGKAKLLPPPENKERETAFTAIIDKYIPNEEVRTTEYIKGNAKNTNVIKIDVEHMTCKQRDIK